MIRAAISGAGARMSGAWSGVRGAVAATPGMLANTAIGGGMGALGGAVMADDGNRMRGAIGGGLTGIASGAALSSFARRGRKWSRSGAVSLNARLRDMASHPRAPDAFTENIRDINRGVTKAVYGFHHKSNRNAVFRSGALLGGGAFGLMFAGNGRSHKRGFNANRGNGFGR